MVLAYIFMSLIHLNVGILREVRVGVYFLHLGIQLFHTFCWGEKKSFPTMNSLEPKPDKDIIRKGNYRPKIFD